MVTATKPNVFSRNHLLRDASLQALYDAMSADPSVHLFGEGAQVKMHYDAPQIERHFSDRVHTMPISEDGNTNFAVGASLLGVKPVVDVISADFLYRTLDSICNTAAKLNFVLGPWRTPSTIVIRAEFLTGGPTTGQRPEALFTHIPGLRVVLPSTPHDAYGLMKSALETPGVTIYFEDRMISDAGPWSNWDQWLRAGVGFGQAHYRRGDVVVVTYGVMRQLVEPLDCGLVDLVSICPLDWETVEMAARHSGRVLIVEPDVAYGGVGAEIAAHIAEAMPHVRIKRLGAPKTTVPAAPSLHHLMLPSVEEIERAIADLAR
mgnify:CR=1 FL=1